MMACRGFRVRCSAANSRSKSVSTREAQNGEILMLIRVTVCYPTKSTDGMAAKKR